MRQWHPQGDDQIRALWQQGFDFATSHDDMNFNSTTLGTISARTLVVHGDRDPCIRWSRNRVVSMNPEFNVVGRAQRRTRTDFR